MKRITSKGRTTFGTVAIVLSVFLLSFASALGLRIFRENFVGYPRSPAFALPSPLDLTALPLATRFDFPIGSENGALSYNAQPFTENRHLGDDLNGIGGENSDMGDAVYATADGRVLLADEAGPGWGKVVILLHAFTENGERRYLQSYYAHLEQILVRPSQHVRRGEKIATVGNADGRYWAHLHFEMREFLTPFIGAGYRRETRGWINPSEFIRKHRGAPDDDVGRATQ